MVRLDLEARGFRVFEISAVAHRGLRELTFALAALVEEHRAASAAAPVEPRIVIRPRGAEQEFTVRVEGGSQGPVYRVLGAKPERWVQQTDFRNDEAVGFLADRLQKLGVEDELFRAGAVPGATVVIGPGDGVVFDWDPALSSAAELISSPRGTDVRLDQSTRRTTAQRREHYRELMDAKAAARAELEAERLAAGWSGDEDQA